MPSRLLTEPDYLDKRGRKGARRGPFRGGRRPRPSCVDLVDVSHDSRIGPIPGCWVLHPPRTGQPAPVRSAARVLPRRRHPRRGRRTVRVHPLGDGRPGPRLPRRQAGPVRPGPQTRTPTRERADQRPRPRPGHRATTPRAVRLRDLRPSGRRRHTVEPHQRRGNPHRRRVRPPAASPCPRSVHRDRHPGTRHEPAGGRSAGLRRLPRPVPHHDGRPAAGHPRPDRAGPARPDPRRRLPRHPGHPRDQLAAVPALAQTHRHPPRLPRRRPPAHRPRRRPVRRPDHAAEEDRPDRLLLPPLPRPPTPIPDRPGAPP